MDDRTLLEQAAKAAGIDHPGGAHSLYNDGRLWDCNGLRWWNPLTDDGDALRLSVDLGLNVFHAAGCAYAMPSEDDGSNEQRVSYVDAGGKYQATRITIARAAAEIGRAMS